MTFMLAAILVVFVGALAYAIPQQDENVNFNHQ